ncbi:MAG: TlpA family protein disulfide reductase [Planctomycetales bacterium]|nr:TlpA family protein disulfide reductase [Planctomycetales bacterium]
MSQPTFARPIAILLIGCALILAVLAWRRQQKQESPGKHHSAVGKVYLPHQFLPLTAKKPVQEADLKGKVVLVNFWGYWCPPCRTEFPHLMDLEKSLQGNPDFRFVSVACNNEPSSDEDELRDRTAAFLAERRAELLTYFDADATEQLRIAEITGGDPVYPTTLIIGRDGTIRGLWPGYHNGDELSMRAVIDEAFKP